MSELGDFILHTGILFLVIMIRYLVFSGVFHYLILYTFRRKTSPRVINGRLPTNSQIAKEIKWSSITSLAFALSGAAVMKLWENDQTGIYLDVSKYPLWYFPVSLVTAFFIHETYYYWLHRWMHLPKVYRLMHKVHHDSIDTTSWTSFSFHPLEAIAQAVIIPVIILFLPMHLSVLIFFLIVMTISGTINHSTYEIGRAHV